MCDDNWRVGSANSWNRFKPLSAYQGSLVSGNTFRYVSKYSLLSLMHLSSYTEWKWWGKPIESRFGSRENTISLDVIWSGLMWVAAPSHTGRMALGSFAGYERIADRRVARIRVDAFQEAFLPRWIVDRLSVRLNLPLKCYLYIYGCSFHKGRGRKIKSGQKVHSSIAFCDKSYHPRAMLPEQRRLCELVGKGSLLNREWVKGWEDLIEMDIFDLSLMSNVIESLKSGAEDESSMWVYRLTAMMSTGMYCFILEYNFLTTKCRWRSNRIAQ